ncbi:glycine-rich domain-containing protein [Algoriphagus halophilus]|uniref:glycine-rich domain-containing protein n=1 Tax=Algoriphagus halophilus TaxID=226505 RepID=UPI00358E88E3
MSRNFSDFTTVTVDPLPIPTFEEEPLANVCVGTSVTYTTQSGSGESNYVWSIQGVPGTDYTVTSGGTSTTDPTVTLTWLTEGSKDVYVYYSNSNNCTPINSAYNNITVNPLPVPTFDEEPGIEICEQDAVTYTTKAGQSDYIWNIPGIEGTDYVITAGGIGDTNESVTIQWLTTGSETVTVSYTDSVNGCIASSTASSTTEVEPFASVGPTSVAYPSVCISSPTLTPFTQATTGVTAIGTPVGLPDGISATFDASTGLITFSGTATTPTIGAQTYSIPLIGDCINGLEATGTIEVVPQLALTSVSSISASSVGGAATVTINGDPSILTNGEYEVTYIMESDVPNTIGPEIASPVTVTNGKGVFRTVDLPEDDAEVYQLTIQSISKIIDGNPVCPVNLDQTSPDNTTYFSVCGATFTADGTFYVPAGITEITVQVWGAGAGGGSKKTKGAGGGGGGFSSVTVSVNPGDPIGVFVGKGGAGGVTNGNSAIKGGDSYVTKNSSDPNPQTTSIAYAYGGSAPTISGPGIGGVGTTSNGQNGFIETSLTGGKGGDGGNGGTGGAGGSGSGNAKGLNGSGPGGGGGGAKGNADGGNGADGFVLISYSCTDANKFDCIEVIDDGASTGTTIIEFICDTQWNAPQGLIDFTVLVGGGGGGGGGGEGSGGGGAGGLVSQVFSTNDPNGLPAGTSYGIVVGEGGPGASGVNQIGQPGEESSFTGSINGSPIEIIVPGGGGGGSFNNPHGGSGAAGGGGGAKPNDPNTGASGEFGNGGTVDAYTYTGTNVNVYLGNIGGEGDFSNSQNSVAGGGSGLSQEIGTNNLPAGIGKKAKLLEMGKEKEVLEEKEFLFK